jgi:hypothetical protein
MSFEAGFRDGRSDAAKFTACRKSARFLSVPRREVKAACHEIAARTGI